MVIPGMDACGRGASELPQPQSPSKHAGLLALQTSRGIVWPPDIPVASGTLPLAVPRVAQHQPAVQETHCPSCTALMPCWAATESDRLAHALSLVRI